MISGAARLRPTAALIPRVPAVTSQVRHETNYPPPEVQQTPETKAKSILDALPGQSLASKTAILSATAALGITGISSELLVINEEALLAFSLLSIYTAIFRFGGPMYSEWAAGQTAKFTEIFQNAKNDHVSAVKERITSVEAMQGVVETTKDLFEVSKVQSSSRKSSHVCYVCSITLN